MARFTFRLPDIGEGISEAEIVAWHVKLGDRVEEDQSVADMMTDKATVEMESPVSGTVVELAGEVGDQVPIGSALMVIETDAAEASPATQEAVLEAENPGVEEVSTPSPPRGEGRGEGAPQATPPAESPVAGGPPPPPPPGGGGGAAGGGAAA
ncbi:biotin/lipoyl-containing protein, partial [Sphingomonas fuzhouensis]|uniref:biotin/lipoyl-containing protein n=1 Tax=Sphingomonas fuzhouensis TaxID=3106033 RepID=UPI002AFE5FEB